jgi:hypothetical protein
VRALFAVEEPSIVGPALYVGGPFRSAGGRESRNLARWGRSASCAPASYCTAGTSANGCVAHVSASGVASASSPSGFTLLASGVDGQRLGTFFYSISGVRSTPWGSGSSFVCVASPTQRTGTQSSGGAAGACNGSLTLDLNAWLAAHPSAMGAPFTVTRSSWAQAWFRDPASPKGSTLSDAIEFAVEP